MKRRNSFEITAEILRLALDGAKKTHLVYKANLNFKLLDEYLANMKRLGLIEHKDDERLFLTTNHGRRFLKNFENLEDIAKF